MAISRDPADVLLRKIKFEIEIKKINPTLLLHGNIQKNVLHFEYNYHTLRH